MRVRTLAVGVIAILLAVQVVRVSAVRAWADNDPYTAARVWAGHPDVRLAVGMTAIATSAREGRVVPAPALEDIYDAARKAPLASEPFLVRGVQAQLSGDERNAERAFLSARWRDGRSRPAHYFLTEHYLRQRDAERGLREIAILARLVPGGPAKLAGFLASYARDPENVGQLRQLFRAEPALQDIALSTLASDASNADLVLELSNPERRSAKSPWLPPLIQSLIVDRQYARARGVWAEFAKVKLDPADLLYDPGFKRADEPPPFNWALTSSTVGLAERQRAGGLHVIYYGQEDGPLASQLIILPPGTYRFVAKADGPDGDGQLRWALRCASDNSAIGSTGLREAASGWRFTVPPGCPAQFLELVGVSSEAAQQLDLTIRAVSLQREQPGA